MCVCLWLVLHRIVITIFSHSPTSVCSAEAVRRKSLVLKFQKPETPTPQQVPIISTAAPFRKKRKYQVSCSHSAVCDYTDGESFFGWCAYTCTGEACCFFCYFRVSLDNSCFLLSFFVQGSVTHCDYLTRIAKKKERRRADPKVTLATLLENILNGIRDLPEVEPLVCCWHW